MGREERAVEFRVRGVTTVPPSECIIVLEEVRGARLLPIHSGGFEAQSLTLALSGLKLPRPLTHDMVLSVVQALGWTLRRVTVCDLSESVFYARVDFEKDGVRTSIDARPSPWRSPGKWLS